MSGLDLLMRQFSGLSADFHGLRAVSIDGDVSGYMKDGVFLADAAVSDISDAIVAASALVGAVSGAYAGSSFGLFLEDHPDLLSDDASVLETEGDLLSAYFDKKLAPGLGALSGNCATLERLLPNVKDFTSMDEDELKGMFSFRYTGSDLQMGKTDGVSAYVLGGESPSYFEFTGGEAPESVAGLLLSPKRWDGALAERFPVSGGATSGEFSSSLRGSTVTFWANLAKPMDASSVEFMRLKANGDESIALRGISLTRLEGEQPVGLSACNYQMASELSSLFNDGKWCMFRVGIDGGADGSLLMKVDVFTDDPDTGSMAKTPLIEKAVFSGMPSASEGCRNSAWPSARRLYVQGRLQEPDGVRRQSH